MAGSIVQGELLVTPDPLVPKIKISIRRDPSSGISGIFYTQDGGVSWQSLLPIPLASDKPGCVLSVTDGSNAGWITPRASKSSSSTPAPTFCELSLASSLSIGQVFGWFRVPAGQTLTLREIQLAIQTTSTETIQIDVVNSANVRQNRIASIQPGSKKGVVVLDRPLTMIAGTSWSLKIIQTGTGIDSGENLTARLVLSPA